MRDSATVDRLDIGRSLLPDERTHVRALNERCANVFGDELASRPLRRGMLLVAAESVLPETGVGSLPPAARQELAVGLDGPIRTALADEHAPHGPGTSLTAHEGYELRLAELRDGILGAYGGKRYAASDVILRVYLARAVRGTAPLVVGMSCIAAYDAMVAPELEVLGLLGRAAALAGEWVRHPSFRVDVEAQMFELARHEVGDDPPDYLDLAV